MTATDLTLVAAIVLLVAGCTTYVALRVRRVAREARAREARRAEALLADVAVSRVSSGSAVGQQVGRQVGQRGFEARSSADGHQVGHDAELVAAAHDLAAELRRTAERVVAIATDTSAPVTDRAGAIVTTVGEAASPYALRRVAGSARSS